MRLVKGPGTVTWLFAAILAIRGVSALATIAPPDITLAVTGRTNSTPWVAAAGDFVAVAWGASAAGKGDIFVATSRDGGRTFGSPVQVNQTAGEARISGEIAPRVSLHAVPESIPEIVVVWNAKATTTTLRLARSRDGGRTFETPTTLTPGDAAGDRGWQALTLDQKGGAHAIWLDHRGMAAARNAPQAAHKGEHDGVAMAQRSGLYYAGPGGAERELFKGVCYCCKTAMATGPDGTIAAAWRHVFDGNMRDMALTISRDNGKTFAPMTRVHQDGWSINGCPDDGPAMAIDHRGTIHLLWPTVVGGTEGALLYSTSRNGTTFQKPVRVPTLGGPKPSHPQIAIDGQGRVVVAWDESREGVRRAAARRLMLDGTFGPVRELGVGPSSYPVLAATTKGMIAVWTSGAPNSTTIGVAAIE